MKEIKIPVSNTFTVGFTAEDLKNKKYITLPNGMRGIQIGELGKTEKAQELKIARKNGSEVIWSTIKIEHTLEDIISNYMFTIEPGIFKERSFFILEIMRSDMLSFYNKKKLALKIIKKEELTSGKDRNQLEKNLADVIKLRNAFAHGSLMNDLKEGVILEYYSGNKEIIVLNDEKWEEIERLYNDTNKLLNKIYSELMNIKAKELINNNGA
ncbi:MAG: hypothetical protein P9L97_02605 [Candidatus Tenebribacter davisii]|nr:hypothetical protein [Candidatus Tenebribacter davisii]